MQNFCRQLYEDTLAAIDCCRQEFSDGGKYIECCFMASETSRFQLCDYLAGYQFTDPAQAIWFFKCMKPQFTGLVEFFVLVYKAILFEPVEEEQKQLAFWEHERALNRKFFYQHRDFYAYYKSGQSNQDREYFLQDNSSTTDIPTCSKDQLLATIIAREKYLQYVKKQLRELHKK